MKRIFLFILLLVSLQTVNAQSYDLNDSFWLLRKYINPRTKMPELEIFGSRNSDKDLAYLKVYYGQTGDVKTYMFSNGIRGTGHTYWVFDPNNPKGFNAISIKVKALVTNFPGGSGEETRWHVATATIDKYGYGGRFNFREARSNAKFKAMELLQLQINGKTIYIDDVINEM